MKIDAILHALLPKDDSFFTLFEKDSENLLNAAGIFRDLYSRDASLKPPRFRFELITMLFSSNKPLGFTIQWTSAIFARSLLKTARLKKRDRSNRC